MEQTKPGRDGASQLIARLNGRRSPAFLLSARGYGAPPPDPGPAPEGRRHFARSVGEDVSGLAPAPAAAPWHRIGCASGHHAACQARMEHAARRSAVVAAAADRRPVRAWRVECLARVVLV